MYSTSVLCMHKVLILCFHIQIFIDCETTPEQAFNVIQSWTGILKFSQVGALIG